MIHPTVLMDKQGELYLVSIVASPRKYYYIIQYCDYLEYVPQERFSLYVLKNELEYVGDL